MNMIPHPNRVVIRPFPSDSWDADALEEKGEVLAVGSACKFLKVGDTVYFDSWGIGKVMIGKDKYYVIQEKAEFVLGVEGKPKKKSNGKGK